MIMQQGYNDLCIWFMAIHLLCQWYSWSLGSLDHSWYCSFFFMSICTEQVQRIYQ